MNRARRAALAGLSAALAITSAMAASPAVAAPYLVGIEDERILLSEPEQAPAVVAAWVESGVDIVRIHARWGDLAPGARVRPAGFDGADHRDPGYHWAELDRAVDLVHGAGLQIMLTVTGPGPLWTSRAPRRRNPRYKPDPSAFRAYAGAVATRYGDRVDTYLVWNEPNIPGWLSPQLECRRGRCTPVAPHLYRELFQAGRAAIKASDPIAEVVAGELAPIGNPPRNENSRMPPLTFLRSMACLDERYRPLPRRGACARFRPVHADAIGHHPHGVRAAPDEPSRDPLSAKIADLPRLFGVLDRLTARGRFVAPGGGRLTVHLTEFGYQTSPPDHAIGIPVAKQAEYLEQAAYLAWRTPRIRSLVHYQWIDEPVRYRAPGRLAYAGWQSGLHFVDGRPKPALAGFLTPFVRDGSRFWGQIRPGARHRIALERPDGPGRFKTVAMAETDDAGFWSLDIPGEPRADHRISTEPIVPAA